MKRFTEIKTAIEARHNKKQTFKTLEGTVICPVFFSASHRLEIQNPKQILSLLKNETVSIETPIRLKADLVGIMDPFAWMQNKYGLIHEVLKELLNHDRKVIRIRTSSDYVAHDDIVKLLKELALKHTVEIDVAYAWGCNAESARFLLPACPSEKRLKTAIAKLKRIKSLKVTKVNLV